MFTDRVSKSALLRASASAAIIASASSIAAPAFAATGTINSVSYEARPVVCRLTINHSITGTLADNTGNDQVAVEIESNTFGTENRDEVGVPVGTTLTRPTFVLDINNGQRAQRSVTLRDLIPGQIAPYIDTFVIPRADLIAEGGKCAEMAPNNAPVVDIGPDRSFNSTTQTVLLNSTVSDADGDAVSYQWVQTSGPTANIISPNAASTSVVLPTLNPTVSTDFTFQLQVTDAALETVSDAQTITILSNNRTPVVDAGTDTRVQGGSTVQLTGSANDPDNDALTYQWVQTSGPSVTLSDSTILNPTFTAPPRARDDQSIVFELTVDDGTVTASDTVEIEVAGNEAPVASATITPSSGTGNQVFTLDGSGTTDPEGDQIFYQWVQTTGVAVTIDNPNSAVTTFTAPPAGVASGDTLAFELRATDIFDETGTASTQVTLAVNQGPTADAGADQTVSQGDSVQLDGTGSTDPEGDPLTYDWEQVSGPPITIQDPTSATPTFLAPTGRSVDQTIVLRLTVDDGDESSTSTVTITVLANQPPVANAGADQGPVDGGATVTLDGTGSTDPDGDTLTYSWVQTSGPNVTLSDATAAQPTFIAPNASGVITFELTVSDGDVTATDTVDITVQAVGTITIVQRVTGSDTAVTFTSSLAALATTLNTSDGSAQVTATSVPVGTYTVTAADLSAQGIAVTDISCSDSDSTGNVASRTATIDLAAGEDVTCTFTAANSREAAQAAIYNYLTGRNALILANQPDLQRRLDRFTGGGSGAGSVNVAGLTLPGSQHLPLMASISSTHMQASASLARATGSADRAFDIWAEASFSSANIGAQDADFRIVHVGADLKIGDSLLVGALAQFDDYSDADELTVGEGEGDGWMVGPYLVARLTPQLYAELRAAWGQSDNTIVAVPGFADEFETSRSLYSGSLYGELELGAATVLRPALTVRYFSEDQQAYTDSLGIQVPGQTVDQGDISLRPRIMHSVDLEGGWSLRPYGEVDAIYTFGTDPDAALASLLPPGFTDTFGDFRGRIEGGLDLFSQSGFRASASAYHDGIGADDFGNTGVQIGVSFGF
ncbi:autotransporter outer membrane beta-barrel domain-containing protein [Aurantiacibacter gangjinensis]|uniref:autotransporter outer membrane beta-barrel domain-containing protein n=1 Tax=Aurantiacibacter gangjinensis TaxID=502682 RepID=UPI00069A20B0|nr:autotransporter outer membrane beta-barrel domain-containing protein [Aurantiacibacter gangjinensis]APE28680.1 Chitinase [Aurantiacibacter gangjinensis]